ncbi:hypothetical protein SBA4_3710015 [Candidatus Sulfopaludibacter sp. SbA4]|nr:hypothetical protein SBA4_3710015 [Candidatus Sulfopaludibacter sp. SbA4]
MKVITVLGKSNEPSGITRRAGRRNLSLACRGLE